MQLYIMDGKYIHNTGEQSQSGLYNKGLCFNLKDKGNITMLQTTSTCNLFALRKSEVKIQRTKTNNPKHLNTFYLPLFYLWVYI